MKTLIIGITLIGLSRLRVLTEHTEAIPKDCHSNTYILMEKQNILRVTFERDQVKTVDTLRFIEGVKK